MKKFLAILLGILMAAAFTACGETDVPPADTGGEGQDEQTQGGEGEQGGNGEQGGEQTDTGVKELVFGETMREDYVNWFGRDLLQKRAKSVACNNTASGFEVSFHGTELSMTYISQKVTQEEGFLEGNCYLCIQIDGSDDYLGGFTMLPPRSSMAKFTLAEGLEEGAHTVAVYKATEALCVSFEVGSLSTDGYFTQPPAKKTLKIEAYGDSIVAGRGSNRLPGETETDRSEQENGLYSYAACCARALGAQYNAFCVSGSCVGNYYNGTDTDGDPYNNEGAIVIPRIASGYSPIANAKDVWDPSAYVPDVILIELGTNDIISNYIYRFEDFETQIKENYSAFIRSLRATVPEAKIVLCCGSFTYAKYPVTAYNALFSEIAESFSSDGNVYCHTFSVPTKKGHPAYSEAERLGGELAEFLRGLIA